MRNTWKEKLLSNDVFWAIMPNVVVGGLFILAAQWVEMKRDVAQRQAEVASSLLGAASDVLVDLYPPGAPSSGPRAISEEAKQAEKVFESLYWGKLGLMDTGPVEGCLTALHEVLWNAVEGSPPSTDPARAKGQIQFKLATIARWMRESLHGPDKVDDHLAPGDDASPATVCRR